MSTNTVEQEPPEVDVKKLASVFNKTRRDFLNSFKGIPTRVDPNLKGKRYYLAVSSELLKELQGDYNANEVRKVLMIHGPFTKKA